MINARCDLLFSGNIIIYIYLLLLFRWGLQLEQAVVPFVNRLGVQFHVQTFAGTKSDKDLNVTLHELHFI